MTSPLITETDYAETQAEAARLTALADDCEAIAHQALADASDLAADREAWWDEWRPEPSHEATAAALAEALTTLAEQASDMSASIRAEADTLERRAMDAESVDEDNAEAITEVDTALPTYKRTLGA